jgi:N4-gp56 family major capsid protein
MAQTTTTTVGGGQIIHYIKRFLKVAFPLLQMTRFGQREPLPMNDGKQVQWFRWNALPASVADALLTEGTNPSATSVTGQDLGATLLEYGIFVELSSLFQKTHIDGNISKGMSDLSELLGQHAAQVIDLVTAYEVAAHGAQPARADGAAGSTFSGTLDSVTSTTVVVDAGVKANAGFGDADDDLSQAIITITGGAGRGQQRVVVLYTTAAGTITVSPAFDVLPVAGDTYTVTSSDAIVSGDKLTYDNILKARTRLRRNNAPWMDKRYYVGLVDPEAAEGLMQNTEWKDVKTYSDPKDMYDGELGKLLGVRFIEHNNPFKFPTAALATAGTSNGVGASGANYTATGNVTSTFIMGRHAFGVTTFKNQMGQIRQPPIIIKTGGDQDTSNPLNMFGTMGWKLEYVTKGLQPAFAQQIWTYSDGLL